MTTKIQPANIDQTLDYSVDQLSANTVVVSGVDVLSYAQSAFLQANSSFVQANSAYTQANTATTNAATADSKAVSAGSYANAAFVQANTDYTTLSTINGVYGGSSNIPVITLAANGRVSSITNTSISIPAGTSVYGNTGQITANVSTGTVALGLATTAVTPGVYGGTSNTVTITVDAYGRVTALSNNAISGGGGGGATLSAVAAATTYYIGLSASSSGTWTDARVDTSNLYYSSATSTLYSTNFNTSSDENLKSSIETILNALETVNLLRGVSFLWKSNGLKSYGVIAQELEKIIPDLVTTDANGRKTVNYNALIGFLIEAIKTQSTQIQSLEERITRLEEK
jgi:hypothetical protein